VSLYLSHILPQLLEGTAITVRITAEAALVAVAMAFPAGLARLSPSRPLRWLAATYIELFRGSSALVQLFWLYFVLPLLGIDLTALQVAVVGLGLNIGAYGAELVRGAVRAVPRGQWEAAIALNLTRVQTLARIVVPQAAVAMVPPWGNLLIELLKATALVSLITLGDLTFRAYQLNMDTFRTTQIFGTVLVLYFLVALVITGGMRLLERRLGRHRTAAGAGR
jgi:polar amino acid transport system permease protein